MVQGAPNHVVFEMTHGDVHCFHGGCWGAQLGVLSLIKGTGGMQTSYRMQNIAPTGGDADLANLIEAQKAKHLTDEDRAIVATVPKAMDIHSSILLAIDPLRVATDADVAMWAYHVRLTARRRTARPL